MSELKSISPLESKLVTQTQNLVRAMEIENNVKFSSIKVEIHSDGTIDYALVIEEPSE